MKTKIIFLIISFVFLGAALFFLYKTHRKQGWNYLESNLEDKISEFNGSVGIEIKDLDTGREIAFNKESLIPSASLVKIPIMLSCFYAAQDGKISLKDSTNFKSPQKVGAVFTVEDLFEPMITQSDNAATNALIDLLGFDTLNAYFKKMGLKNTNISRKMMDFEEKKEGLENYTTAQDMAYLLEGLYHKKFLNKGVSEKCLELLGQQKINDRIPRKLPNGTLIAHKTGLEKHICHDVGIVFTDKGDFLICVLAEHKNRLAKPAKKFISEIALLTYDYYRNLN